jgi:ATP-dependent RNA helicase DDX21
MLKKRERKSSLSIGKNKVEENEEEFEKINKKKQKIVDSQEEDEFQTLGIHPAIVNKLKEMSINSLFEVQKRVFKPVYSGKHIICASLTGSGKTLSFVLPLVQKCNDKNRFNGKTPVLMALAPTRELSIQVGRNFTDLVTAEINYKVALIYGGVSIDEQIQKLRRGVDIIVGTPGRIIDMIERGELNLSSISSVVLDEADKMLSMGFQEDIELIFSKIHEARSKSVQVCLFSATIESWVKKVASKIMRNEECQNIDLVKDLGGRTPKTVQHLAVNSLKSDKVTTIADLILCYGGKNKSTIVFVNTKRECNDLMISDKIKQEVQIIHGDINQKQREATIEGFKKGKYKCLVATDVASRGLDIPMVDLVIQSDPPKEIDTYIHRAGRTARAGRTGTCITLYSRYTESLLVRIEQKAKIKFKKIGAPQRNEIIDSSIRDIKTAMNGVDDSMVDYFTPSAKKCIDEYGPENALARLFAYVSGHSDKIKSRSLLCGAEGFITYSIKFNSKFNHQGYIWGFFKRIMKEEIKSKIRGMKMCKTMDGCVFDFPEDGHKDFEEIIFNDRMYGTNYTMTKIEELPELMEANDFPANNSNTNGNNFNQSNRFRSSNGFNGSSHGKNIFLFF